MVAWHQPWRSLPLVSDAGKRELVMPKLNDIDVFLPEDKTRADGTGEGSPLSLKLHG